jgi:uncharacterized 2Fe-2S/4Fe-4S cluster protein (DUF4445 family)
MNIECGTIASAGAVEAVRISGSEISISTISNEPANGICGSGIVDAVAQMYQAEIFNKTGRFRAKADFGEDGIRNGLSKRIVAEGMPRFVLGEDRYGKDIFISQKDVRQVQLAKAAIAAAIRVLMKEAGIDADNVEKIYIAGGFGKHLRLESLVRIGLIPAEFQSKVVFAGNTAKSGATLALLDETAGARARLACKKTRYFELSVYSEYERIFLQETSFPETSSEKAVTRGNERERDY